jgi:hypothetical protein
VLLNVVFLSLGIFGGVSRPIHASDFTEVPLPVTLFFSNLSNLIFLPLGVVFSQNRSFPISVLLSDSLRDLLMRDALHLNLYSIEKESRRTSRLVWKCDVGQGLVERMRRSVRWRCCRRAHRLHSTDDFLLVV